MWLLCPSLPGADAASGPKQTAGWAGGGGWAVGDRPVGDRPVGGPVGAGGLRAPRTHRSLGRPSRGQSHDPDPEMLTHRPAIGPDAAEQSLLSAPFWSGTFLFG